MSQNSHVRTVLTEPLQNYKGTSYWWSDQNAVGGTLEIGSYQICLLLDFDGSAFSDNILDVPRTFGLRIDGSCKHIIGGNPTVNLDPRFVGMSTILHLDMSHLNPTTEFIELNDLKGLTLYLLTKSDGILDDSNCDDFPDPLLNDEQNPNKPVFTTLPNGKYAIHDYYTSYPESTFEKPLMDGGANDFAIDATYNAGVDRTEVTHCYNKP